MKKGNKATPVDPKELGEIYQTEDGLKCVGVILYTHSSPGCVYIDLFGNVYKICY